LNTDNQKIKKNIAEIVSEQKLSTIKKIRR
jgi:hypothetical protein